MVSPSSPNFLPEKRSGVLLMLEATPDDVEFTPEQIARIRELYFLDSNLTVEEHVRAGDIS